VAAELLLDTGALVALLDASERRHRDCASFFAARPWTEVRARRASELMLKYDDVPMDYADATLVALAEELKTSEIFTLDRKGFTAYRWQQRRAFRIHP
jgi:predicted nucleic acid-binding protein